jgi:protein SCO1/2
MNAFAAQFLARWPKAGAGAVAFALAAFVAIFGFASQARADSAATLSGGVEVPAAYRDVRVREHLNGDLPLDARFYDENSQFITLRDLLKPDRPILLQLGYLECPMLCDTISRSLIQSAKKVGLNIGSDFNFVFVSIDPTDTPTLATLKHNSYVLEYDRPGSSGGFHVLVGKPSSIQAIAQAVGFDYQPAKNGQFAHPAVAMVITPDGKISRYLYGVTFPEQTLRLSLVEAAKGKIGTTVDQVLLICLDWDPSAGKYSMAAMRLVRLGGVLTLMVLGSAIFWMVRKGSHPAAPAEDTGADSPESDPALRDPDNTESN